MSGRSASGGSTVPKVVFSADGPRLTRRVYSAKACIIAKVAVKSKFRHRTVRCIHTHAFCIHCGVTCPRRVGLTYAGAGIAFSNPCQRIRRPVPCVRPARHTTAGLRSAAVQLQYGQGGGYGQPLIRRTVDDQRGCHWWLRTVGLGLTGRSRQSAKTCIIAASAAAASLPVESFRFRLRQWSGSRRWPWYAGAGAGPSRHDLSAARFAKDDNDAFPQGLVGGFRAFPCVRHHRPSPWGARQAS